MGECISRPSDTDIENHILELNSKNDSYFRYFPFATITDEQISSEKNICLLENKLNSFKKKKSEFQSILESTNQSITSIPELNIEVQKGLNLKPSGVCLNLGKPIVIIRLEPNGPHLETFKSNIHTPYWYRFFQFKQTIPYTKIVFEVVLKKDLSQDYELGKLEIKISELEDQNVKEDWFSLKSIDGINPCLKIRLQYIYNEKALLQDIIEYCNCKIDFITEAIQKIFDGSHNSF
jgi:C2 domain